MKISNFSLLILEKVNKTFKYRSQSNKNQMCLRKVINKVSTELSSIQTKLRNQVRRGRMTKFPGSLTRPNFYIFIKALGNLILLLIIIFFDEKTFR